MKTLEAHQLHDDKWTLLEMLDNDKPVSVAPFDATEFPLSTLWV